MPKPYFDLRRRVVEEVNSGASWREATERTEPERVVIWVPQRLPQTHGYL
jgi:hypothetical protein